MGTGIAIAVDLLTTLLQNASAISGLIQTATAEGRTTLTASEWAAIVGNDDSAEASLIAAIAKAKGTPAGGS